MVLARAGLRVLVVDRSRYGADTLSTHALLRGGVLQLARWGLLDRVTAAGTPPVRRSVFHYGEERIEVPIKPAAGVDALYAPRRTVLDPILVDAARDAGAEVRFGVTVTGLCRDSTGRVTGVVGRDDDRRPVRRQRPDHRRRRRHGFEGRPARRRAGGTGRPPRRRLHLRLLGPASGPRLRAVLPARGHRRVLPHQRRPGLRVRRRPAPAVPVRGTRGHRRAAYARLLAEAAPGVLDAAVGARRPSGSACSPARPGFLRRAHGPGWALVGDAGYFKDPITSHGITDALRDAELLARAILTAATGEAAEEVALADYQATRDRLSERLFATTDAIASFDWDLDQIPRLLRQLSDSMSDEVKLLTELEPIGTAHSAVGLPYLSVTGRDPAYGHAV